jgi:hypothetical protein
MNITTRLLTTEHIPASWEAPAPFLSFNTPLLSSMSPTDMQLTNRNTFSYL